MSDCYICGKTDSHTYGCPKLSSSLPPPAPLAARPSMPGAPTSSSPIVTFKIKDKTWRIDVIKQGMVIPLWATHAWFVDGHNLAGKYMALEGRALEWEDHCSISSNPQPGHTLEHKGFVVGTIYPEHRNHELIVFGPL